MTRKPTAFAPDDAALDMTPPSDAPVPATTSPVEPLPQAQPLSRMSVWAKVFWTGLSGLISIGVSLYLTNLVTEAFAKSPTLGTLALIASGLFLIGLIAIAARETLALRRITRIDGLRIETEDALARRNDKDAHAAADRFIALAKDNPRAAHGLAVFRQITDGAVIDGRERLRLLEREILEPLDREALRMVAAASRRVSLVTALSPRAVLDLSVVFYTAITLIRRLAELYGGRPGTLGQWRLFRHVLGHLALTGTMAAGDEVIQQLLGQGLAAKLSAKLGEGVMNGLLTARLGLAAVAMTRPLPYIGAPKPDIRDFAGDVLGRS